MAVVSSFFELLSLAFDSESAFVVVIILYSGKKKKDALASFSMTLSSLFLIAPETLLKIHVEKVWQNLDVFRYK